jgi:hypothetical protein
MLQLGIVDLNEWSNSTTPSFRAAAALHRCLARLIASARQQFSQAMFVKNVCLEPHAVSHLSKSLLLFVEDVDESPFLFGALGELTVCQPAHA